MSGSRECPRLIGAQRASSGLGDSCQVELTQGGFSLPFEVFDGRQALPQGVGEAGDGGAAGCPFRGELCVQGCGLVLSLCGDLGTGVCGVAERPTGRLLRNTSLGSALTAAHLGPGAGRLPMMIRHDRQNDPAGLQDTPFARAQLRCGRATCPTVGFSEVMPTPHANP